jgi:predicted metal-dependent peptidase
MRRKGNEVASRSQVWEGKPMSAGQRFPGPAGKGGRGQSQGEESSGDGGDVLADELERELYPDEAAEQAAKAEKMKELAAKALALAKAMGAMKGRGVEGGGTTQVVEALRGVYRTPWESMLQRWLESVAPGERTFARPSRRSVERDDIVLPGRRREGWLLNVVLDTSASMADEIPRALGALADFCDAVGVDQVRIVQCDTAVSADDFVAPEALAHYEVTGYGGSDLSPALLHLAADPHTRAVVVVTDGDVVYPAETMPYSLLWLLPANGSPSFRPPYGRVLAMQRA